jgi:tetratricopeptide (TPR) repeat protein
MHSLPPRSCVLVILAMLAATATTVPAQDRAELQRKGARLQTILAEAEKLQEAGKATDALKHYEQALTLATELYGPRNITVTNIQGAFGEIYREQGEYRKAAPFFVTALRTREVLLGKDHVDTARVAFNLAWTYRELGEYAEAEALFLRVLATYEAKYGKDHPEVADALHNLAKLYRLTARYAKAEALYLRSLDIMERKLGKEHPKLAYNVNGLAILYEQWGQYQNAEAFYLRALRLWEAGLGEDHPHVAAVVGNLGGFYKDMAEYEKAESYIRRSLAMLEGRFGKESPHLADPLGLLGSLYRHMGELGTAKAYLLRALALEEAQLGKEHPNLADAWTALADLYLEMLDYRQAEALFERSLRVCETQLGPNHPAVAASLNNLAGYHAALGQYDKSGPLYRRALKIEEAQFGSEHPGVAVTLANLAGVYAGQKDFARAESAYRKALRILEAKFGKEHPQVAATLSGLASVYLLQGDGAKAEPVLARSLQIYEAKYGNDHSRVADCLDQLAGAYFYMSQPAKALSLCQRALKINEAKLKDHPRVGFDLHYVAAAQSKLGHWTEAIDTTDRARRIIRRFVHRCLPALSESEQLSFLQASDEGFLHGSLNGGLQRPDDPHTVARTASWLLNGKAVAQQALAERALLARDSTDANKAEMIRELKLVRSQLAALTYKKPEAAGSDPEKRLAALNKREATLTKELAQAGSHLRGEDPWVELDDVRKALARDAVLIEIARFRPQDLSKQGPQALLEPHYVAWVIPPLGEAQIRIIDLGEAARTEAAVKTLRQTLAEAPRLIRQVGEAEAEQSVRKALQAVARLVLEPLMPHVGQSEHWVLSPDADLWLVPWAALPLANGQYAIEKHQIRYLVSGRDLVQQAVTTKVSPPLLVADPDYDLLPSEVADETRGALHALDVAPAVSLTGRRLRGTIGDWNVSFAFSEKGRMIIYDEDARGRVAGEGHWSLEGTSLTMQTALARYAGVVREQVAVGQRTTKDATDRWQFRLPEDLVAVRAEAADLRSARSSTELLPKVPRLPGTAAEVQAIGPHVKALAQCEPRLYTGKQAVEAAVKGVQSPRLLVLSTHGFFLPDREMAEKNDVDLGIAPTKGRQAIDNPLLRCGLLLAGCNQRDKALAAGVDDGVLTGLEVVGCDLRGTELVVLSACETGLGEVRNGDGVAGLRQAFQLAGARSVLATLWQIPDRETARLMNDFFAQLAAGQPKDRALRQAQLTAIKARRERNAAAHPFYWAAFTVTGKE